MLKKIGFSGLLLVSILLFAFKGNSCSVNYKGIYAYQLDNEHSAILRFYEDGTVLASTSVNDYLDVMTWFNKDNKDMVLKGTYKIKKCGIKFHVSGMTGEQEYEGEIDGEKIAFELKDKGSKQSTTRTYSFFALGN